LSFPYVLAVALALAMDVLAVSLAIGLSRKLPAAAVLRLASAFGLFQAGMTLFGSFAGEKLVRSMQGVDHWVAFGLLFVVGVRMGYESFRPPHLRGAGDPSRGLALVTLAVATSIDALAVGLSLAALHASLWYPAAVIGAVSFILAIAGMKVGPRFGKFVGRWAELLGGAILIAIGVRILVTHLAP
jgi:putative Mn2+ efflux pump MntP